LDNSDSHKIQRYISNDKTVFTQIAKVNTPASPHLAAEIDNVTIDLAKIIAPERNHLIVEGQAVYLFP
jgi:dethiobiotin synthetase